MLFRFRPEHIVQDDVGDQFQNSGEDDPCHDRGEDFRNRPGGSEGDPVFDMCSCTI